jgi:2-polyprenyl-3-methyl-5-hydroxy-6-metoxy-1,4-benzoquinol methylase
MADSLRHIYAQKALSQIPRLLSLQDRNRYSPTYGCFKRTYWLDKTVDFPDALPQYGVSSLTLAYTHDLPGNIYKDQEKILEWILAGMRFWTKIQHRDGSFDEFYPNEHGWTGPSGFLLYSMMKSYLLLEERGEFPEEFKDAFFHSCRKAADYIIKWDENGVLANHHAMAVLPVYYTYHVLQDNKLLEGYEKKLEDFLSYHTKEGWSLEYDGADIGYLSATVSFLGKVYKLNQDPRLKKVMEESTEFLSYFVYPNGFYAGSMGSRQTLHFYSHGCEILAPDMPLAGAVADAMLESLANNKIVPAEIQSDRYFLYRIPEHLESYIDYAPRTVCDGSRTVATEDGNSDRSRGSSTSADLLPYNREDFTKIFNEGRFYIQKKGNIYFLGNAAKGGVTKVFDVNKKKLLLNDCGIIGKTTKGTVLTSQWVDPQYEFIPKENGFAVSGSLHTVPANKIFTPLKRIVFVLFMLLFGWHTGLAYRIKGFIRMLLVFTKKSAPIFFYRDVQLEGDVLRITDKIKLAKGVQFESLQLSDEFFVRYVPQSYYFQSQEFDAKPVHLTDKQLHTLNSERKIHLERTVDLDTGEKSHAKDVPFLMGSMGIEYSEGRKTRHALKYRLKRRGDEIIEGIRTHFDGEPAHILDMGPAEGKMLSLIQDAFPNTTCTGLEYSQELIDVCDDKRLTMIQGDVMKPPFKDGSFDVITASAIIEHVDSAKDFISTAHRLLKPDGLLIITTPDPFFDKIAERIGHVADDIHQELLNLKKLDEYLRFAHFKPVQVEKFMCSPWGAPGECVVEGVMKKAGFSFLLLNQLAIGKKEKVPCYV